MALPPRTKLGLTRTGYDIFLAISNASSTDVAVPASACFKLSSSRRAEKNFRSSACSILLGEVPMTLHRLTQGQRPDSVEFDHRIEQWFPMVFPLRKC